MKYLLLIFAFITTFNLSAKENSLEKDDKTIYYNQFVFMLVATKDNGSRRCSAFNAGDYAITNNHCMKSSDDCKVSLAFFYGKEKGISCEKFLYTSKKFDLSIFRLKGQKNLSFLPIDWTSEDNLEEPYLALTRRVKITNDPFLLKKCYLSKQKRSWIVADKNQSLIAEEIIIKRVSNVFYYCDQPTIKGNSGSPVLSFNKESEEYKIVGIIWGISRGKNDTFWTPLSSLPNKVKNILQRNMTKRKIEQLAEKEIDHN